MPPTNGKSKLQFFVHLPSEIVFDILSRLPIRTIVICKCVCRAWRDLLRTREFADFHISRSVPGLVIAKGIDDDGSKDLEVYEFDDELGLEQHDLHYKLLIKIDSVEFLIKSQLHGSVNGLVLLHRELPEKCDALYVCNPITREYIELLYDRFVPPCTRRVSDELTYGFGVSKISGQYKVVRIINKHEGPGFPNVSMSICLVYTLGTGMWRNITPPVPLQSDYYSIGICLNGNLHWLVELSDDSNCIIRFDLETETFSRLSLPSGEYGDEKSWSKEFVISKSLDDAAVDFYLAGRATVNPIKVFKDGDILILADNIHMLYYSNKTKTFEDCAVFGYDESVDVPMMNAMLHTSSIFPLSSFGNERVSRC